MIVAVRIRFEPRGFPSRFRKAFTTILLISSDCDASERTGDTFMKLPRENFYKQPIRKSRRVQALIEPPDRITGRIGECLCATGLLHSDPA